CYVHAGVVTSLLDSACGYAALTLMPPESEVLSVEFKTNLLAPARGELLRAEATVLRSGRTLSVCRADAFAYQGGERVIVATMLGTMMRVAPGREVSRWPPRTRYEGVLPNRRVAHAGYPGTDGQRGDDAASLAPVAHQLEIEDVE